MDNFGLLQFILTAITALTVGGIIGSVIKLRYAGRSEKALSKQQEETAEALELNNVEQLIRLYKGAIKDFNDIKDSVEKSYQLQLENLKQKIANNEIIIAQSNKLIEDLTKSLLKVQVELKSMKEYSEAKCDNCIFRVNCEKYITKK